MRTFTPEEVAGFLPRPMHYYHQYGAWDANGFQAWLRIEWDTFTEVHGLTDSWAASVAVNRQFTAWLEARCPGQTPAECVAGPAVPDPPG